MKGTAARMGVMKRVSLVFKAKANKALDKMEDPRETLDYSYQRQLELLTKVRRGVADVATSRKRVELQIKVDAFRTRKETIKATYTAAEAQTRINEAFSGISEEMGDVGMAIQRAEDKTAQMQARAGAIDELMASGALEDFTGSGQQDDIQAELDRMSSTSDVELEMRRLKGELGEATAPAQIEGARGAGQPSTATAGQASQQVPPAKPA